MVGPDPSGEPEARDWLTARATELGFAAVGFARPPAPDEPFAEGLRLREWLDRGYAGNMGWLERTWRRRADPRRILPEIQTVVALAWRYPSAAPEPRPGEGRVAGYARGRDYHNVLGRRSRKLARALCQRWPGAQAFPFVDRGPVLEKAWAARAGLGWIGKNTLLLHAERGSLTLLAVLLTTVAVPVDSPGVDQCGSCRLCLDSCPTGAFPEPYVLDARKCLSYLTIEERGAWPANLRAAAGDHVFGCDVCQDVCPWNLRPLATLGPGFGDAATPVHEPLAGLLALDAEQFADFARGRPLARPGRDGLVRNACIAAGNAGGTEWVAPLTALLADPALVVRDAAAWALNAVRSRASP